MAGKCHAIHYAANNCSAASVGELLSLNLHLTLIFAVNFFIYSVLSNFNDSVSHDSEFLCCSDTVADITQTEVQRKSILIFVFND